HYSYNDQGLVTHFNNTIRHSLTIQTRYGTGNPGDVSAYGRGTTAEDVRDGNITLGFHESCHRKDFLHYLQHEPRPQFGGRVGMTVTEFDEAIAAYNAAWQSYFHEMEARSVRDTDETGNPTRSQWCAANPDDGACQSP